METPHFANSPATSDTLLEDWCAFRQRTRTAPALDDVKHQMLRTGTLSIGLQVAMFHWKCADHKAKIKINGLYGKFLPRVGDDSLTLFEAVQRIADGYGGDAQSLCKNTLKAIRKK